MTEKLTEFHRQNEELKDSLQKRLKEKEELVQKIDSIQEDIRDLSHLRGKYKAVQRENYKLYNMVQDLRGNIRVFCRVRPLGLTGDASERAVNIDADGKNAKDAFYERVFRKSPSFLWTASGQTKALQV